LGRGVIDAFRARECKPSLDGSAQLDYVAAQSHLALRIEHEHNSPIC
jgi:hypothetical protein